MGYPTLGCQQMHTRPKTKTRNSTPTIIIRTKTTIINSQTTIMTDQLNNTTTKVMKIIMGMVKHRITHKTSWVTNSGMTLRIKTTLIHTVWRIPIKTNNTINRTLTMETKTRSSKVIAHGTKLQCNKMFKGRIVRSSRTTTNILL